MQALDDKQRAYLEGLAAQGRDISDLSAMERLQLANLNPQPIKKRFMEPGPDRTQVAGPSNDVDWNDEASPLRRAALPLEQRLDMDRVSDAGPDRRLEVANAIRTLQESRSEADRDPRARTIKEADVASAVTLLSYYEAK